MPPSALQNRQKQYSAAPQQNKNGASMVISSAKAALPGVAAVSRAAQKPAFRPYRQAANKYIQNSPSVPSKTAGNRTAKADDPASEVDSAISQATIGGLL